MTGEIGPTPWPNGVTGLFVRLPAGSHGFVDVVSLPRERDAWTVQVVRHGPSTRRVIVDRT